MLLSDILFPRECPVCGRILLRSEKFLCLGCETDFPYTYFWNWENNPAEILFWGRLDNVKAVSLFYYREGSGYKEIIHRFKYNGERSMGRYFSAILGEKMASSGRFDDIDLLVPVPLHFVRKWKRGFNQSHVIAKEISSALGKPVADDVLVRRKYTGTQTVKDPEARWKNVFKAFAVKNEHKIRGKHILIVDDVLTTGATAEACGRHLTSLPGCRVSIATLGFVE
jgi:ComF family protein